MSCHPSLSKSARFVPQNHPGGLALVCHDTSSKVPSPLLRSSVFPDAMSLKTCTNFNFDCLKISKNRGISVHHTPCRQALIMYRNTVGHSANHASSERIWATYRSNRPSLS